MKSLNFAILCYSLSVKAELMFKSFWETRGLSLSELPWISITDRASLETGLSQCNGCILSLEVENGTEWLHLGGDINNFLPIVTAPSQHVATSDLSLHHAIKTIQEKHRDNMALYISFKSTSILNDSLEILTSVHQNSAKFPVLLAVTLEDGLTSDQYVDILSLKFPTGIPVIGWKLFHGMDQIWNRIKSESLLLNFQQLRMISIIDHLYNDPFGISKEDIRFAQLLHRKIELSNPSSFTLVVLDQLLKALEANKNQNIDNNLRGQLRPKHSSKPVTEILSDYYDTSSTYSEDVQHEMNNILDSDKQVGILLRAGHLTCSGFPQILKSQNQDENSFLVIRRDPTDRETFVDVENFVKTVGSENVLVGLPRRRGDKSDLYRIPQPQASSSGGGTVTSNMSLLVTVVAAVIYNVK